MVKFQWFSCFFLTEDSNSPLQTDPFYSETWLWGLRPEPRRERADKKTSTPLWAGELATATVPERNLTLAFKSSPG